MKRLLAGACFLLMCLAGCERQDQDLDHIGFNLSDPEVYGYNTAHFDRLLKDIDEGYYGELHSIILVHDENLLWEKYFHGRERNDLHEIQSSTKSIASLLAGMAISHQYLSLEDKMVSFFKPVEIGHPDSLKSQVTVENMLSMSAGFLWDEWSVPYGKPGNSLHDMYEQAHDYVTYMLDIPTVRPPGVYFNYNSGVSFMLGVILERTLQNGLIEYAEEQLFYPLDIYSYDWKENHRIPHCGGGLHMRPVDMAKIGSLVLNGGSWMGKQIIAEDWISETFVPRHNLGVYYNYGYHWWMEKLPFRLQPVLSARGHGWQTINIAPQFDLVFVTTGNNGSRETVFSELTLILDLAAIAPGFKIYLEKLVDQQINDPGGWVIQDSEVNAAARLLNNYGDYRRSFDLLSQFEGNKSFTENLYYTFLMGEASYHVQEYEKAETYLQKHLSLNTYGSEAEKAFYEWAQELMKQINNHK